MNKCGQIFKFTIVFGVALIASCQSPPASSTPTSPLKIGPSPAQPSPNPTIPPTFTATLSPTLQTALQTTAITQVPSPVSEHRIGIRVVDGIGEFFDRLSGERFVLRGNNLIQLAWQKGFGGEDFFYHSTFNVGMYAAGLIEQDLQQMHEMGYNTVRVFIQGSCKDDCIGNTGRGLSAGYIANIVDFLQKTKANGIFVILTTDAEPGTPYYINLLGVDWSEKFGGTNNLLRRGACWLPNSSGRTWLKL